MFAAAHEFQKNQLFLTASYFLYHYDNGGK